MDNIPQSTKDKLKEVKTLLGKNYRKVICDDTEYSPSRVSQVFQSGDLSHPILQRAVALAQDRKTSKQTAAETLESL